MERILIVDDDPDIRFNLSTILKGARYDTLTAQNGREALKVVKENSPHLVLLDIRLPEIDGMRVLEEIRRTYKDLLVVMLTAYSDAKDAVTAMKLGAVDYLCKPFDNEELLLIIGKALQTQHLTREVEILRKKLDERKSIEEMMGESPRMKRVLKQVELVALTNMTVIVQGESGTGKELIAQLIHQKSLRKDKPLVALDCGAIPETLVESELFGYEKGAFTGAAERHEGRFEQAAGGTLLLDEIANLTDGIQMKLLRVLEERKLQHLGGRKNISVDVRIIVATNTNLLEQVRKGRFRDDLYHRINEFRIELPRLAERKEDMAILPKYFLEEANREFSKTINGFSGESMRFLLNHTWPGNVRELKNAIRRAALLAESDTIELGNFSMDSAKLSEAACDACRPPDRDVSCAELTRGFEKDLIKKALESAGGSKVKAAELLKMNKKTLYRRIGCLQL